MPATGPESEAARRKLQPVFAEVGAPPEALNQFRHTDVRLQSKNPAEKEDEQHHPAVGEQDEETEDHLHVG